MFNKKYKMEIEQLRQENDALKAQIAGIAFNLGITDKKNTQYEAQIDAMKTQIIQLQSEIKHLNMLATTSNKNQNDSRYY
jgi:chromosome segregation ATPase